MSPEKKSIRPADQSDAPEFRHTGFFALRTPLLPFDEFLKWGEGLEAPTAPDRHDAGERDRATLRGRLSAAVARPSVWDAVFVACPDLDQFLERWRQEPDTKRGRNTERTLVRYLSRMTSRATPFGLFAGLTTGRLGTENNLRLPPAEQYRRHTRLSLHYLQQLVESLRTESARARRGAYHPNSSLYEAAGRIRYVEARPGRAGRSFHLVAVDENEYITTTLDRAAGGATIAELSSALAGEGIEPAEAERFILALIENQILVADLAPPLTGENPLTALVEQLEEKDGGLETARLLRQAQAQLQDLDRKGLGARPADYRAIEKGLDPLPGAHPPGHLFQVDMTKPAPHLCLKEDLASEIVAGVQLVDKLLGSRGGGSLERFRKAFVDRYEGREVPLFEALDDETGIGFTPSSGPGDDASPLLEGVAFPYRRPGLQVWGAREKFLLGKLTEALGRGLPELELAPAEIEALEVDRDLKLPDAFSVTVILAAASEAEIGRGNYRILLDHIDGPSGACLLGRFCYADDELRQQVKEHLRAEEALNPQAVYAEVVHLPDGHVGNILCRPVLRDYEIPYLGRSGVRPERQLPLSDLSVSVRDDRVVLRSASLGREVIPRLTNAHNYTWRNLGVYTFLCALQEQDVNAGPLLDWGPLSESHFLPRVTCGRLVLSLARWRVGPEELAMLGRLPREELFGRVRDWRTSRGVPRLVTLEEGDNALLVDFDNILSVESFVHLVKSRRAITLTEQFPAADQLCVRGPEGAFTHEILLPLVRTLPGPASSPAAAQVSPAQPGADPEPTPQIRPVLRSFPPGSEWLYVKLYTGQATVDLLLRELVRPVVDAVLQSGAVDQWFFIRYGDPDWHLRLRLHGSPEALHREVLPLIQQTSAPFIRKGQIRILQLDTYTREIERYGGGDGVELAEELFHHDSEATLEIVESLDRGDRGLTERWQLTLRGMDMLLDVFGLDTSRKHALAAQMRASFAAEFRADKETLGQIADRFRRERADLLSLLGARRESDHPLAHGVEILNRRSERAAPVVFGLNRRERERRLSLTLEELLPSYLHMSANRLLRFAHRAQELMIYDFLERLYRSQLARG